MKPVIIIPMAFVLLFALSTVLADTQS